MKKYDDNLEKMLTAIFGVVGIIAIIIKLIISGFSTENIIDAIKEISGLVVVIAVFLVANKLFRKVGKVDFTSIFENQLKDWISQNDYLVCENFDEEGKGKYNKRYCSMVIDHSNILTRRKSAKDAAVNREKGAFVYLPYMDDNGITKNEFEFRFNERTFDRQEIYRTSENKVDLPSIISQISSRIEDNFRYLEISSKPNPSNKTITVSFEKMEQTEANARKLINLVEFVKTLVLALA